MATRKRRQQEWQRERSKQRETAGKARQPCTHTERPADGERDDCNTRADPRAASERAPKRSIESFHVTAKRPSL